MGHSQASTLLANVWAFRHAAILPRLTVSRKAACATFELRLDQRTVTRSQNSGITPVRALLNAGAPVGHGVDGSATNKSGRMVNDLHQALLAAQFRRSLTLSDRRCL